MPPRAPWKNESAPIPRPGSALNWIDDPDFEPVSTDFADGEEGAEEEWVDDRTWLDVVPPDVIYSVRPTRGPEPPSRPEPREDGPPPTPLPVRPALRPLGAGRGSN